MLLFGRRLAFKGDWDPEAVPDGRLEITLVPQNTRFAFGNAYKTSTRKYLNDLETLVTPDMKVIDIGAGVGPLAIAAVKLGASGVVAIEPSELGIGYCSQNIQNNGVGDWITLMKGWWPFVDEIPVADLVLCNVDVRETLLRLLVSNLAPKLVCMPAQPDLGEFYTSAALAGYTVEKSEPDGDSQYVVLVK